jgi:tetratricopeptide (TPR) repeat protein
MRIITDPSIALYGIVLGQPDALGRTLDSAVSTVDITSLDEVDRPYLEIVSAYARLGRQAKARAVLGRYDTEVKDTALIRDNRAARSRALGWILLAEGKGLDAVRAFTAGDRKPDGPIDACTICLTQQLSLAYDRAGLADSAIVYYERFVNDWYPFRLSDRRLGKLYEARGDRAKAISNYQRFIALWAKAEPELQPMVREARERLNRLLAEERKIGP